MAKRSAYSLFELILVMAILVMAAGISFPLAQHYLTDSQINAASDMVRARWAEMRGKAIAECRPYAFVFQPEKGNFKLLPWLGTLESSIQNETDGVMKGELPAKVKFRKTDGTGEWTAGGIIYPDGTALQDVAFSFGEEGGRHVTLRLRAFTGVVTIENGSKGDGP